MIHRGSHSREYIKQHLVARGAIDVCVTPRIISHWWNHLSVAVFDGTIPCPKDATIGPMHNLYATVNWPLDDYDYPSLCISHHFDSRELFLNVLVHEMVHVWEFLYGDKRSRAMHGKQFMNWKRPIYEATSLKLSITY